MIKYKVTKKILHFEEEHYFMHPTYNVSTEINFSQISSNGIWYYFFTMTISYQGNYVDVQVKLLPNCSLKDYSKMNDYLSRIFGEGANKIKLKSYEEIESLSQMTINYMLEYFDIDKEEVSIDEE